MRRGGATCGEIIKAAVSAVPAKRRAERNQIPRIESQKEAARNSESRRLSWRALMVGKFGETLSIREILANRGD